MTLWRHIGDGALPRKVEIWNLICSFLGVSLRHPPSQKPPRLLSGTSSVLLDFMMTLWRHIGDGALPRKVEIWNLICSFLGVSLRHLPSQKPPRLLSGASSVLLDFIMTLWRHIGDGAHPRKVEIQKLICSFLDESLGHPSCQKHPRPLSGTTSVLLDFMLTLWRHIGDEALPRKVENWKFICSFLDVSLGHPPW